MQVVQQTPSQLVVHDSRWATVILGAIFTASGGGFMWLRWTHPEGWSGNGGPWLVYLVGGVFMVAGLLILWYAADRRYIIDRATKTVSIVTQRLVHRQTTVLPFADISDVALEQSSGMSSGSNQTSSPTWRVVFLMKNGTRVPWTPYSTNMRASQETCAAAVRTFGGWAGPPEHQVAPMTPPPALIAHPAATNWGCLAAFLSIFVAIGLGTFGLEVYRLATYRPIPAMVYSTSVATVRGNKGSSYKPVVSYGYTYAGQPHYSSAVTPITISASYAWAEGVVSKYRAGSVTTAYVNPGHPEEAYLLRQVSLIPLVFVAAPLLFGALFGWTVRVQRKQVELAQLHLVPVV